MALINKQDTNGVKCTLAKGEFGFDDYVAGGDQGRVYVGDGTTNVALATKAEVDAAAATGGGGATGGGTDEVFYENDKTVTTNYTITSGKNAMTAGDITINTGITVTVPTGSRWVIV